MLRRKLLIVFGSLVILLVATATTGVWMLQGILRDLDHVNTEAVAIVDLTARLNRTLTSVEIDLYQLQLARERYLDTLIDDVEAAQKLIVEIGTHYVAHEAEARPFYQDLIAKYPQFMRQVSSLATAQDVELARQYNVEALASAMALRKSVSRINHVAREHARHEQLQLSRHFRWLVVGMAISCMLVVNISIIILLRAAGMVLKPVDQLVETSRQFGREHFEYRAHVDGSGEFSELAQAYNSLAERVQKHERQRMETLEQVALTLNHELNNAMETINLQLQILDRQVGGDEHLKTHLQEIRKSLRRMAQTVASLKNIRRIVLTEYTTGVRMLDLQRSTRDGADESESLPFPSLETDKE